ncbi:MAG: 30S ribosomal protein S16 [Bacteroidales bacterium]|nr:30S ribosomal protein S16 [Bacteroidales bacterium]
MPTRIRLQRKGKKGMPFYHVVIADGRAPRDGKYIERIGTYNPLTTPAEINIDADRAIYWLQTGASPTDTVRSILSSRGILLKNHLLIGVKKGAITEAQAEAKFNLWWEEKQAKLNDVKKTEESKIREDRKNKLSAEKKINEARAEVIAKKLAEEVAAKKAAEEAAAQAAAAELAEAEALAGQAEAPVVEEAAEPASEVSPEQVDN